MVDESFANEKVASYPKFKAGDTITVTYRIEEGDKDGLEEMLQQSSDARRALPMAWIPSTDDLLEVRIPMEDRTGVIAEVTTIASSVGCNIQSIEIDHMTEDSAVLSMVLTDEGDVGKLSLQLIKAGYTFSFHPLSAGGR